MSSEKTERWHLLDAIDKHSTSILIEQSKVRGMWFLVSRFYSQINKAYVDHTTFFVSGGRKGISLAYDSFSIFWCFCWCRAFSFVQFGQIKTDIQVSFPAFLQLTSETWLANGKFSPCFTEFNSYLVVFDVCHYIFCLHGEHYIAGIILLSQCKFHSSHHKPFCGWWKTS